MSVSVVGNKTSSSSLKEEKGKDSSKVNCGVLKSFSFALCQEAFFLYPTVLLTSRKCL